MRQGLLENSLKEVIKELTVLSLSDELFWVWATRAIRLSFKVNILESELAWGCSRGGALALLIETELGLLLRLMSFIVF